MIAGLQKMTLLDYPGKVACTVFLAGCNFRCPFCHNAGLLAGAPEQLSEEELLSFLKKRQGLLDGVCITGGEPTLYKELPQLLKKIKALGFFVKLDSNGTNPAMLKSLVSDGLVDYVAMDIKNSPNRYGQTAGISQPPLEILAESIRFLIEGDLDYEFRTTVVQELHSLEDFTAIGRWLKNISPDRKAKKYFLQQFVQRDSVLRGGLSAPDATQLLAFREALLPYVHTVEIRGID